MECVLLLYLKVLRTPLDLSRLVEVAKVGAFVVLFVLSCVPCNIGCVVVMLFVPDEPVRV